MNKNVPKSLQARSHHLRKAKNSSPLSNEKNMRIMIVK